MTFHIQTFNTIDPAGLARFEKERYQLNASTTPDGILLRSFSLHDQPLAASVQAIARAGAGTNNIPIEECTEKGIVVFNTPGANANAVKELVIASLLLAVRPILEGARWSESLAGPAIEQQVENHKKQFAGTELEGKRLGIIGLGAIGAMVANDAYRLGMNVSGYDPYVSVDTAWSISRRVRRALSLEEILTTCDFITVHVPLNEQTRKMIASEQLAQMKPGATLLNFARGGLVDNLAVLAALQNGHLGRYITDFPEEALVQQKGVLLLPHLGASTAEAETNCAKMAAKTLKSYLETGNIQYSVNFPTVELPFRAPYRLAVIHQNIPNMLGKISSKVADLGYNIDNLFNRSRGDYAYTLVDLTDISDEQAQILAEKVAQEAGIIRVRAIQNLPKQEEF